ncbi:unnamed protein product [Schistocephalus solidus]|uniref:Transmembrane protein n=1 Tax=Schistocephalus solidus TaxID=70667 RepID=A0A183TT17_SCHSO|nr:unnamed protein product [Schistocephalus solidus]
MRFMFEIPTNILHHFCSLCELLARFRPGPASLSLILKKTSRLALTSISDVIESIGRWNRSFRVTSRGLKSFRIHRGTREEVVSVDRLKAAVRDTPPDETCCSLPLLFHPSDLIFHRPIYSLFPHVRYHQLPPHPTPTLQPRGITTLLLSNLYLSPAVVGAFIFLIG